MKTRKTYEHLVSAVQARINCLNSNPVNPWHEKHEETINAIVKQIMPSGSGIDCGTKIDLDKSSGEKLVFTFGFHHMNEGGYYDGWTEHTLTVKSSLQFGIELTISGRNRNYIKEYLYDTYRYALTQTIVHEYDKETEISTFKAIGD